MPRSKETSQSAGELIPFGPSIEMIPLPPNSGVLGRFLEETANMFKARAMRMNGLLRKIDESGLRMETLLRTALVSCEAAEAALQERLGKQGLTQGIDVEEDRPID